MSGSWKIDRKVLLDRLTRIQPAIRKHPDAFTRMVLLTVEDDDLSLYLKAADSRFRTKIPLLNREERIEKALVTDLKSLLFLLNTIKKDHVSFERVNNKFRIRVLDGAVDLENFGRMAPKIRDEDFWKPRPYEFFRGKTKDLERFLDLSQKSFPFNTRPEQKRACVVDSTGCLYFSNSAVVVRNLELPEMGVRSIDIPVLRKVMADQDSFWVQSLLRDYLFKTDEFEFSCPCIRYKDVAGVKDYPEPDQWKCSISIPLTSFLETSRVVVGVTYALDLVVIENQSSRLVIGARTKTGRCSSFPIQEGVSDPFKASISSGFLDKLVSLLSAASKRGMGDQIEIRVGSDGRVMYRLGSLEVISGVVR